jgi:hypothetical protein
MSKLLTVTAIVLMMAFTACLVSAAQTSPGISCNDAEERPDLRAGLKPPIVISPPTATYPWSGSGTVYFMDNITGTVTPQTGAQITINQAVTTAGEPQNFYYGVITTTLPGGSTPTNISISVIVGPEDQKACHISGSSPQLSAEGRFLYRSKGDSDPTCVKYWFSIRGAIYDTSTLSFQGVFSN